jgi:nucleotidyltransferase substrate binding protein (TIGR01987 family)
MNERFERIFNEFENSVKNLTTAVEKAKDDLEIDGAIKRFEMCYELSWKVIKLYLENLGIICKNPRDCFKQAKINDLINDEIIWMEMIDTRNRLVHEYSSSFSREIFNEIKNKYNKILYELYETIKKRINL